ncbi:MAG: hypothetical protein QM775_10590 [Pirellulales bacterium]
MSQPRRRLLDALRTYWRNIPWGRTVRLDAHRVVVCDLLHFAKRVPSIPVQRTMNLAVVQDARLAAERRISWAVLFTKAFAKVAEEMPELRRCYLGFPAERLYEHPESVASISVEKKFADGHRLAFAKLTRPESRSLVALDRYLKRFAARDDSNMGVARLAIKVARLWRPLRLAVWWAGLNLSGTFRSRRLGTFGVSVYSSLGAESLHPIAPLPFLLNYGVIASDGTVDVRVIYDHRVLDGATIARALAALEATLNGSIARELQLARQARRQLVLAIA